MPRCQASTATGHRCKARCVGLSKYCIFHSSGKRSTRATKSEAVGKPDEQNVGYTILRNQVITRSAPIAGRAITVTGAAVMARGVYLRSQPVSPKKARFSVITEKTARTTGQRRPDTAYYKRGTLLRRSTDIGEQEKRVARKNELRQRPKGRTHIRLGSTMMVAGRALPVLAYGYVGIDMIRRQRAGEKVEVKKETESLIFGQPLDAYGKTLATAYGYAATGKAVFDLATGVILRG